MGGPDEPDGKDVVLVALEIKELGFVGGENLLVLVPPIIKGGPHAC